MFKSSKKLSVSVCKLALLSSFALTGFAVAGSDLGFGAQAFAKNNSILKIRKTGVGVSRSLTLGLNKAIVIDLPKNAHDILVADPSLADAVTRTSRRIYLFGKSVGQTNIFIFGAGGEEIINIDLRIERDVANLQQQLARFIPESNITVEIISDNIVLTGSVRTPQDAARAAQLAEIFLKGGEATTRVTSLTSETGDAAISAEDRQTSQIVNLLNIDGEDQVTLKVTVAEVSRQILKQLGVNSTGTLNGTTAFNSNNPANLGKALVNGNFGRIAGSIGGLDIASYINAMERAGVMRTLAEPSLTAISGEAATFYVGGEFNLTTGQNYDSENNSLTYENERIEYGIRLNFTPLVLGPGRISLKIRTEVSEPTFEAATSLAGGGSIPGTTFMSIRKREAETSVELPSGGSIVIAGLIKDDIRQAMSGYPGFSKIPVLGSLFRSRDFVRSENELVIIATPYLVKPVSRQELSKPDDNFTPASDGAGFFLGKVNRVYGQVETELPEGRYHGSVGFIFK
ncbi:MAG: type II and III secretion system protein family protein [Lentilitoribacter sp.]